MSTEEGTLHLTRRRRNPPLLPPPPQKRNGRSREFHRRKEEREGNAKQDERRGTHPRTKEGVWKVHPTKKTRDTPPNSCTLRRSLFFFFFGTVCIGATTWWCSRLFTVPHASCYLSPATRSEMFLYFRQGRSRVDEKAKENKLTERRVVWHTPPKRRQSAPQGKAQGNG